MAARKTNPKGAEPILHTADEALSSGGRRTRRTVIVGNHGDPPRRVRLDMLEVVVRELRAAVDSIAADVGITADEVGGVELIDLVDGSGGAVFEQSSAGSYAATGLPLAMAFDGVAAFMAGKPLPPILTSVGRRAIEGMALSYAAISQSTGRPVYLHALDGSTPIEIDIDPKKLLSRAKPETDLVPPQTEETPQESEWLLQFTGTLHRLDGNLRRMWVTTKQGDAIATLSAQVFAEADEDSSRWKFVKVVCLASSPDVKKITSVLHVTPAPSDAGQVFEAMPMSEAAKGLGVVLAKIEELGTLQRNWNSYGASPPSDVALKVARGILLLASSSLRQAGMVLISPFITPLANGGVQFEWESGHICLELEVTRTGDIEFLRMIDDESAEGSATREGALHQIDWYHQTVKS